MLGRGLRGARPWSGFLNWGPQTGSPATRVKDPWVGPSGPALTCGIRDISGELWFSREIAHYGKSLISIFQEFFASIDSIFILVRGLSTWLSFYGV